MKVNQRLIKTLPDLITLQVDGHGGFALGVYVYPRPLLPIN